VPVLVAVDGTELVAQLVLVLERAVMIQVEEVPTARRALLDSAVEVVEEVLAALLHQEVQVRL